MSELTSSEVGAPGDRFFDIVPGEVALCDYSKPPDIHCRRVKTVGQVSDGYHTFDELYAHRVELFIALCRQYDHKRNVKESWRSARHSDGTWMPGWFVLGLYHAPGLQVTYHLPMERWDECGFAETLPQAPEFDGHTSADVLERLKLL